jgi:hypothetical protein
VQFKKQPIVASQVTVDSTKSLKNQSATLVDIADWLQIFVQPHFELVF